MFLGVPKGFIWFSAIFLVFGLKNIKTMNYSKTAEISFEAVRGVRGDPPSHSRVFEVFEGTPESFEGVRGVRGEPGGDPDFFRFS